MQLQLFTGLSLEKGGGGGSLSNFTLLACLSAYRTLDAGDTQCSKYGAMSIKPKQSSRKDF